MTTPNRNASSPPEYYGGLEVDTRSPPGGGWNPHDLAKFRVADQNNLPQVHDHSLPQVAPYHDNDYSMPQAVDPAAAGASNGAPGAGATMGAGAGAAAMHDNGYYALKDTSSDSPEVVAKEVTPKRSGTICGMRKKMFWLVLAVAIAIVTGAAVGGGVGGAMAAYNSQSSSGSSDGSSSGGSGSGSGGGGGSGSGSGSGSGTGSGGSNTSDSSNAAILPTTNIGSLNFTDQYGFENHLVFYQMRSKNLIMSSWNSSTKTWSTAKANTDTDVKEGTPISNSLFWHSKTGRDIRIYYLNDKNQVMGQINGNPVYTLAWDKSGVSELFTAGASSQLLSNGIYTPDSYLSNLVLYQDSGSTLRVLRRVGGNTDWVATGISTDFGKPADGTGLAFIPIYTTNKTRVMNLFYASDAGSLIGLTLQNDNDWSNQTLPTTVEKSASIAAFSSGYENNDLKIHVLATQTDKAPVLTVYSGGAWTNEGEIESMSGDDKPVKIAANLGGRVYGVVERSNNTVEIVEWEWTGGTTYTKIGAVDVVV